MWPRCARVCLHGADQHVSESHMGGCERLIRVALNLSLMRFRHHVRDLTHRFPDPGRHKMNTIGKQREGRREGVG
jgi:hypothetical protein